ncbi:MAG TPA: hypothetical protein ENG87_01450, partial [Candidatus Pacearchaeota archaeon]|nr:hypothetical protein [Candidatus Pacearchaeota archaeon]
MAKKKPKKIKKITNILIIAIIVLAVIFLISLIKISVTANAIKEQKIEKQKEMEVEKEWLMDNCECIARDIIRCMDGFEF